MSIIVTRTVKGFPLTYNEMDANFNNLNTDKLEESSLIATNITNTPSGSIIATTVQAAINELDTKKAPIAAPIFTGVVTSPQYYNVTNSQGTLQVGGVDSVLYNVDGILEQGLTLISTGVASNSATIDFTSIKNTVFNSYVIMLTGVDPVTAGANLYFRISNAGVFSSTGYSWQNNRSSLLGITAIGVNNTGIGIALTCVAADTLAASTAGIWRIDVDNCSQTTARKRILYQGAYLANSATGKLTLTGSGQSPTTTAIDGFRFIMDNGNISTGTFKLYGRK
jgi:hypothetical protein